MKKIGIIGVILLLFLTACSNKKAEKPKETDTVSSATAFKGASMDELKESYDVIVIGSGGGGMSAAIAAKDKGVSPVIFEKMPIIGGNTLKSSAGMNASGTKFQKEQNIEDSNDLFYEETLKGGKDSNNPELLRYFVENSASAIEWLESMNIKLDNLTVTGGMSVKRTHRPTDGSAVGEYLAKGLLENVQSRKIPLYLQAEVKEIIKEGDHVTGVRVVFNGKEEKVIHSKSVVVATGGFGANETMITEYQPNLKGFVTTNQKGSTGDGVRMIKEVGGDTVDMDAIQIHPTVEQKTSYLVTEAVRGEGAILVSQSGERFYNEMGTRDNVSQAVIALPEKYAYLVFDEGVKERIKAINTYIKAGFVLEGETLEELAKKADIPESSLVETVSKWNESVANKNDALFARTTGMDHDISKPKYYAIRIAPGVHHTMGGVKINTNAEVLDTQGTPIKGLYASGEVVGGIHGDNRIGGNAVADIIIFGRQAGNKSAEFSN